MDIELPDKYDTLERLTEVSSVVNEFVVSEEYRTTLLVDEVNTDTILRLSTKVFFSEFKDIGIFLDMDVSEVYDLNPYMDFYEFIYIDNLHSLFRSCPNIYTQIKDFCNLVISGEIVDTNEVLKFLLEIYTKNKLNSSSTQHMSSILLMTVYTNEIFTEYLNKVIQKYNPHIAVPIRITPEQRNSFLIKLTKNRSYYERAVKYLSDIFVSLNTSYLNKSVEIYDLDKIQSQNSENILYAYINKDNTEIDEYTKISIMNTIRTHESSASHHLSYYLHNNIIPTHENLIELICHHVEVPDTDIPVSKHFHNECSEMISVMSDHYSKDVVNMACKMYDLLSKSVDNLGE